MIMILLVLIFIATRIASGAVIHEGFIDEVVTTTKAMSGTFAPNPRNSNRPMMILNAKNGQVHVLEDPDESSDSIKVLDLSDGKRICNNGERGLHTVIPSPNFVDNQYLYAFFTKYRQDCRESSKEGPFNVVTRFPMNPITLMLDFDKGTVIWRGKSPIFNICIENAHCPTLSKLINCLHAHEKTLVIHLQVHPWMNASIMEGRWLLEMTANCISQQEMQEKG